MGSGGKNECNSCITRVSWKVCFKFCWKVFESQFQTTDHPGAICNPDCPDHVLGWSGRLLRDSLPRRKPHTQASPGCLQA